MTQVLLIRKTEDCLDDTVIKELQLDQPICEELMRRMAVNASLDYYPHFPRPYFRIRRPGQYVLQGVMGSQSFRATFLPAATAETERELVELVEATGTDPAAPTERERVNESRIRHGR